MKCDCEYPKYGLCYEPNKKKPNDPNIVRCRNCGKLYRNEPKEVRK